MLRDFSLKGPWGVSEAFLLYVFVTRSTSGCFRVISSIKDCQNTEGTRKPLQFRDGFGLLLLQILAGTCQTHRGNGSMKHQRWGCVVQRLAWIFQEKSMPPPWRGRKTPLCPSPECRRVGHWAHLVFGDEGFDLINVLWHGLLVPLDQGCLSPLDPSQELFQKLCVGHQLGKRRLQSLLVLLCPRENLLEMQRRPSAQGGKPGAGTNTTGNDDRPW